MKRINLKSFLLVVIIATVTLLSSCRKEVWNKTDYDITSSQDNSYIEQVFNDVSSIEDEAAEESTSAKKAFINIFIGQCATISHDTTVSPRQLVVDFGDSNCLCYDGEYRRGKINVSYTGRYREEGATHTTSFEDYYVNDNKVEGSKTVTNNGKNTEDYTTFTINVDGQVTLADDKGTITQVSTRTRTWLAGEDTWKLSDDIYELTGSSSGTNRNGKVYEMEIIEALLIDFSCAYRHFIDGIVEITPEGKTTRRLDYGDGDCDNKAVVSLPEYDWEKEITLYR